MTPVFEVLAPGLLSTIQDLGRPDAAPLGAPRSGACDPWSLGIANLLLGNERGTAALEVTLAGAELRVLTAAVVGLAGADLGAVDEHEERRLAPGGSYRLRAGTTLAFRGPAAGGSSIGARGYVAVGGGFDVPRVLGSASTCLAGAFGGFEGRALRTGDRLAACGLPDGPMAGARWPSEAGSPVSSATGAVAAPIRILAGPHVDLLGRATLDGLASQSWTVGADSDRMGLRLDGEPLVTGEGDAGTITSVPMTWGAIQLPPGGRPIVLLADHQTVGGYPVLAVVCAADLGRVGQLPPGAPVRLALIDQAAAAAALESQARTFRDAAATLGHLDRWDRLAEAAEG